MKYAVQEERLAFVEKMLDEHRSRTWQMCLAFSVAIVIAGVAIVAGALGG